MSTNNSIKHNTYRDGMLQSLEFLTKDNQSASIGVILPGTYNLGKAKRQETILIVSGSLTVILKNGYDTWQPTDAVTHVFKKGQEIKFTCAEPVVYYCLYN